MLYYLMYIQVKIDLLKYMFKRKFYLSACIYIKKGGVFLAYLWTITVGFLLMLGLIGGVFFHFVRSALDPQRHDNN
ncbi:hypothetical protein BLL40_15370 [Domibacillus mangrovi]|uniref:Uncharacterized protein n=1 Tax=Domibacillus mangrovi TaxID=1714354 RepID=A0A1Q5NZI6_9BACI|nr:hypothetical protein BLL40_15370 [Domibacillus mangrovi]